MDGSASVQWDEAVGAPILAADTVMNDEHAGRIVFRLRRLAVPAFAQLAFKLAK